jgi:hypothetical protein
METCHGNKIHAQKAQQQYHELYTSQGIPLQHASITLPPCNASNPTFNAVLSEDVNGIAPSDFDFDLSQQEALFPVQPFDLVSSEDQTEQLHCETQLLHLEALDEEFEGGDDETIPRMADEF